ncbi:MAG: hypothetical protein JSU85_01730 [Candidatus Zixiibacteriota bacterium]|nr:MAG: hypothetical protein JSU85_01730 [candidate division Zixibacteria bacterium]
MNLIELLQQYAGDIDREKGKSFDQSLSDDDYEKDERAGILEHDGNLSREEAEKAAGIRE